jgi:plastocyanin
MGRTRILTIATGAAVAGTLAAAGGVNAEGEPPIAATANGYAFTGGLSFAPDKIDGRVGQTVRWTNTDVIAPHTITEDHGLFDLVGNNVNGTPITASGFGPATSVDLVLAAGTISYFCRVHPGDMKGVLAVPVTLQLGPGFTAPKKKARTVAGRKRQAARRRAFQRTLTVTWAKDAPATGEVYDVEIRRGSGAFTTLAAATTKTSAVVRAGRRGTVTTIRARLRAADDATRATGWSPGASVTG